MNKAVKIIIGIVVLVLFVWVIKYFKDSNSKAIEEFKTETPFYTSIKS